MSIKISFMHYMEWTRVMLPVVFKEFEMVYIFLLLFSLLRFLRDWYNRSRLWDVLWKSKKLACEIL